MVNRPSQDAAEKRDDLAFTVDDQFRIDALREAVRSRNDHESGPTIAGRAVDFYKFLTSTEI